MIKKFKLVHIKCHFKIFLDSLLTLLHVCYYYVASEQSAVGSIALSATNCLICETLFGSN